MRTQPKTVKWLIFAVLTFLVFVLLQVPAAWLISKFYPQNQNLHNVSGNIWHGSADWRQGKLNGSLNWQIRPLDLLLLRIGANIDVHSGNTRVAGVVGRNLNSSITVKNLEGQLAPKTLKKLADWQWPSNAIQFKNVAFKYKPEQGFMDAKGNLQWTGGELIYTFAQRQERMNVPSLQGKLADEQNQLLLDVRDQRDQRMLNLKLDPNMMIDVQLTQRMLTHVPSYEGKAGLDTYVISTRQPLLGGVR